MELRWLNRKKNQECILFFNGWGMDPSPFAGIPFGAVDVLMAWDYRSPDTVPLDTLEGYQSVHLVAWSMGVWVAAKAFRQTAGAFTTRTAIAGTLDPIHDRWGLPVSAYDDMADTFTPSRLAGFYQSMFDNDSDHQRFLGNKPGRTNSELAKELIALRTAYARAGTAPNLFTHVLLTSRDLVFPVRNQIRSWKGTPTTRMDWPHFPFYTLASWQVLPLFSTKK